MDGRGESERVGASVAIPPDVGGPSRGFPGALRRSDLSRFSVGIRGAVWGTLLGGIATSVAWWLARDLMGIGPLVDMDPVSAFCCLTLVIGFAGAPGYFFLGFLLTLLLESFARRGANRRKVMFSGLLLGAATGFLYMLAINAFEGYLSNRILLFDTQAVYLVFSGLTVGNVFGLACALSVPMRRAARDDGEGDVRDPATRAVMEEGRCAISWGRSSYRSSGVSALLLLASILSGACLERNLMVVTVLCVVAFLSCTVLVVPFSTLGYLRLRSLLLRKGWTDEAVPLAMAVPGLLITLFVASLILAFVL